MTQTHIKKLCTLNGFRVPVYFLVDTGAPKSVVGKMEVHHILQTHGVHDKKLLPSQAKFKFANAMCASLGTISIPFGLPANTPPWKARQTL